MHLPMAQEFGWPATVQVRGVKRLQQQQQRWVANV
jgi:hypothetical protein